MNYNQRGWVLMKEKIKKIMPYWLYNALKYNPVRLSKKQKKWEADNSGFFDSSFNPGSGLFLLNTPTHKNLGDLAIAEAEIYLLNREFPDKKIFEVSAISYNIGSIAALKKIIPEGDVILFHGGGYIGSDWPHEEEAFRRVVLSFPKNRIILLPQSIFYSDDKGGRAALKRSIRDLSHHKDLHFFARETISYDLMKRSYPNAKVYLSPDIVLSMDYNAPETDRKGVLLCLRADREKLLDESDAVYIEKFCSQYGKIEYTDTFAPEEQPEPVKASERLYLVNSKLEQFNRSALVVTDRLHGMVFAALTGTPCVALSNHNHKVKGTAQWITGLGYVRYIDDINELPEAVNAVLAHGPGNFDNNEFNKHFEILTKLINTEA